MKIRIEDWYDLHNGFELELKPGVTCLVGPNGAGKTTLLAQLNEYATGHNIPVWKYSNYADGKYEDYRYLETDTRLFAQNAFASEGEKVAIHFSGRVGEIGRLVTESRKTKQPAFVLLDALDSGASIDRARDLFELFKMIDEDIWPKFEAIFDRYKALNNYRPFFIKLYTVYSHCLAYSIKAETRFGICERTCYAIDDLSMMMFDNMLNKLLHYGVVIDTYTV